MRTGKEPYGVRFTNKHGQSTIYTYASAKAAKECVAGYQRDPEGFKYWKSITYVGRKW